MRIFIGCSSKEDIPLIYKKQAEEISEYLKGQEIVIGGTKVGLMKIVTEQVPQNKITQIILKDYIKEDQHLNKNVIICNTSFERTNKIWELSNLILFLPGGTGTLNEILTFLEENRMQEKKKKIIVLNTQGFYDDIISFIKQAKKLKFIEDNVLSNFCIIKNIEEIKDIIGKDYNNE